MRNSRDYSNIRYLKRHRRRQTRVRMSGEFWLLALVLVCIIGAARLDYIVQRDCNGNSDCLSEVMP